LVLALLINFLLIGFWHGANWTFIVWGLLHAVFMILLLLIKGNKRYNGVPAEGKWLPSLGELAAIITTFLLVCFAEIFFRAPNMHDALGYIKHMFTAGWGPIDVERRIGVFIGIMLL